MKKKIYSLLLSFLISFSFLSYTSIKAQPANNNCSGAIELFPSPSCNPINGTTVNATQSIAAIACDGFTGTANDDVWFKFVATSTNPTIRVVSGSGFDAVVDLRSGNCNGTNIACADQTVSGGTENIYATGLNIGATYYVRVYGYDMSSSGTFTICVIGPTGGTPPINDNCSGAITLTPATSCSPTNGTTVNATQSISAIVCGGLTGTANDDVWFKFVATSTNPTIRVVSGSGFDAVVDLRSGNCNGTNIACADQTGAGGTENINATGLNIGSTYYVRVYGYGASSMGTFTICVIGPASVTPPVNDNCSGAITLQVYGTNCTSPTTGTVAGATQSLSASGPCDGSPNNDVWYKFVATATSHTITVVGSSQFDAVIDLRSGSCNGTNIACMDDNMNQGGTEILTYNNFVIGQTYYIRVYDFYIAQPSTSTFTICVTTLGGSPSTPVANFSATPLSVPVGGSVTFTDLSTGNPTSWSWQFAQGAPSGSCTPATSTLQNRTVVYNQAGTYNVRLVASNAAGSDTHTKTAYITVTSASVPTVATTPISNIAQTSASSGGNVTDAGSSPVTARGICWSTSQNPTTANNTTSNGTGTGTYTSSLTGLTANTTYYVRAYATNSAGTAYGNQLTFTTTAAGAAPVANFQANVTNILVGDVVNFTDLSTNTPTGWTWQFAVGQPGSTCTPSSSNIQNPTVIYNTPGTYTVRLTATNAFGNDTEIKNGYIIVSTPNTPPVANFTASSTTVPVGSTVIFNDISTGSPYSWNWVFALGASPGVSTPPTATQQTVSVVYNQAGTYTVMLTVANAHGSDSETKSAYITVTPIGTPPPNDNCSGAINLNVHGSTCTFATTGNVQSATQSLSAGPCGGTANNDVWYKFVATASNHDITVTGSADFDPVVELRSGSCPGTLVDCADDTGVNSTEIINATGLTIGNTYYVRVYDYESTMPSTTTFTICITTPGGGTNAPVANFIVSATNVPVGGSVNFTDLSTNNPSSWNWHFAVGSTSGSATPTTSTQQNPTVVYNTPGIYTVTLTATNANGSDTHTKTAYITVSQTSGAPISNFSASATNVNVGDMIYFSDMSSGGPNQWYWQFAVGASGTSCTPSTSSMQSPSVVYNASGTYTVSLIVSNSLGNDTEIKMGYITVNSGAGINDVDETKPILIYPNPSNGLVTINMDALKEGKGAIKIFDAIGNIVIQTSFESASNYSIDLSHLSNGIYLINIVTSESVYFDKLLLQK